MTISSSNKGVSLLATVPFQKPIKPGDDIERDRAQLCTELNAARMLCDNVAPYLKFVPELGWLVWTGTHWKRDDLTAQTMAQGIGGDFRSLAEEYTDKDLRKHIFAFARKLESSSGIKSVLEMAAPSLATPLDEFDRDHGLLNFRNCTLDLDGLWPVDSNRYQHNSAANITRLIPHDYNAGAVCRQWERFLERIFPDAEVRAFLQRAIGYSLTGSTREQCLFICHGGGANGKSVFLNTLGTVLGAGYAAQADPRSFTIDSRNDNRGDIARLRGARFVAAIETSEGKRLDEALIKSCTGGEPVVAKYLYREPFQFLPEFKLWLATNHKPTIPGTDYAIWRRIRLIPFDQTIPEDERDPDLQRKLEREAEGILNWAVQGAVEWLQHGLQPPAAVLAATEEYRHDEDQIGAFIQECCATGDAFTVPATKLYEAFCEWSGTKSMSQTAFGKRVTVRGVERQSSNGRRVYRGIGLRAPEAAYEY